MPPASRAGCADMVLEKMLGDVFRSFPALLPLHRISVLALTGLLHQGAGRGALRRFLPLAALTPQAVSVQGERPKPNSRAQKKDHENKCTKQKFKAPEPTRTDEHRQQQARQGL
jgi:hypothetical protein